LNLFLHKGCDSLFFYSQLRGVFHTIFIILDLFLTSQRISLNQCFWYDNRVPLRKRNPHKRIWPAGKGRDFKISPLDNDIFTISCLINWWWLHLNFLMNFPFSITLWHALWSSNLCNIDLCIEKSFDYLNLIDNYVWIVYYLYKYRSITVVFLLRPLILFLTFFVIFHIFEKLICS
jgi:hypothetical protein